MTSTPNREPLDAGEQIPTEDAARASSVGSTPLAEATGARRAALSVVLHPQYALPLITFALGLYLSLSSPFFLTSRNIFNITEAVAIVGIAAAFATMVVIGGGLDLSPVVVFIISGIVCAELLKTDVPVPLVVAIGILTGGAIGLLNGMLIALLNLNPFIVTLGTNFLFTGAAFVITDGEALVTGNKSFQTIGTHNVVGDLPIVTVIMAGAFAIAFMIMRFTRFGVHLRAIGGDEDGARLSGVPVTRTKIMLYVVAGLAAGLSGVVLLSATGSVVPFQGAGQNDLLTILAAVIIGGTALEGGRGTVIGTLVGILLLGIIANGLVLKDVSTFWQPVIIGAVLLLAIIVDELRRRAALKVGHA